ncbi:MAG: hypothetical protein RBR50_10680 [Candidatus Izemoplasmatales bacterium]|nr:hypothetical protein [Candidatus Izemoplasmatales bacterium]
MLSNLSARLALRLLKPEGIKLEIAEQERLIEDEKKLKEKYLISTIIFFIITLTIVGGLITFMPFIDRLGRYSKSSKKIKNIEEKINKLNIKLMTIRNKNT